MIDSSNVDNAPSPTPTDLLGFDPLDPAFVREPYRRYAEIRQGDALLRTRAGLLVATTHELCSAVLRSPRFGHGDGPARNGGSDQPVKSFLAMDPPDHTRLRGLVSKEFTPSMVKRLRPRIEAITAELIASLPDEADLLTGFAYPLPVMVISEMLGVPAEDHERFRGWSETLARGLDPIVPPELAARTERDRQEFRAYFRSLIALRRERPGDDLLSALAQVEELTEPELLATCVLLLVAGHETTVNLIANGVLNLVRHETLASAAERPKEVVEEVLRYDPPVQLTMRVALEDTELAGTPVPAGTHVLALIGAANRDPAAFPDPDRFDVDRAPGRHLAFGLGIHFCLGAPLARLEGEIALRALAEAAPKLELTEPEPPYKRNIVLRGLACLPVRLRR
ncbi:cytochrome P450 [Nonomuraea sp. LPB2021202275-12-8]|uniref:cytochrome P450 n=1 Tax=Nonomuraea sp. LPB2021202275-12-8 TaxID=3120159 RepID=UPI00300C606E